MIFNADRYEISLETEDSRQKIGDGRKHGKATLYKQQAPYCRKGPGFQNSKV
jgi:hypothetical protein